MASEVLEIDTKGTCLLCLRTCTSITEGGSGNSTPHFKMLMRYLKIDILKMDSFSSSFLQFMDGLENVEMLVSLCSICAVVTKEFFQLFQQFDNIRMQLDRCCQTLHSLIKRGQNDGERVKEYRRRVKLSRKPADLFNASVAEKLRNEAMQKCALRLKSAVPKVMVNPVEETETIPPPSRTGPKKSQVFKRENNYVLQEENREVEFSMPGGSEIMVQKVSKREIEQLDPLGNGTESSELPSTSTGEVYSSGSGATCAHCGRKFKHACSLRPHMVGAHPLVTFADEFPPSTTKEQLKKAMKAIIAKKLFYPSDQKHPLGCQLCLRQFPDSYWLKSHFYKSHLDHVIANLDSGENSPKRRAKLASPSPSKKSLPLQIKKSAVVTVTSSTQPEVVKKKGMCSRCGKHFPTRSALLLHHRHVHRNGLHKNSKLKMARSQQKLLQCEYCNHSTRRISNLQIHQLSAHALEVFSEQLPSGTTKAQLQHAMNSLIVNLKKNPLEMKTPFGCPFCDSKRFHDKFWVKMHILQCHLEHVVENLERVDVDSLPEAGAAELIDEEEQPVIVATTSYADDWSNNSDHLMEEDGDEDENNGDHLMDNNDGEEDRVVVHGELDLGWNSGEVEIEEENEDGDDAANNEDQPVYDPDTANVMEVKIECTE